MKLVAYCRVSTEDKGQDPERQADVIRAWAAQNGHEIVAFWTDLGTSGSIPPLSRPVVKNALASVKANEADGLVVEAIDRWTRGGIEDLMVSRFQLRLDHDGVILRCANAPGGLPPAFEDLWDSMLAATAQMWLQRHSEAVRSGYARARRQGFPNGRPGPKPKPGLTREELDYLNTPEVAKLGIRLKANALSKLRGAYDVADTRAQRQRRVGPTWLCAELSRIAERREVRQYRKASAIEVDTAHPGGDQ